MITNPKGIQKTAFPTGKKDAVWTSKYSSLTINQYGKEFPIEGVNEMGLVVQTLILPEAHYSKNEKQQSVNELQFIQYQLDNYANVAEVIEHLAEISIVPVTANVHYFIADSSGNAAVIDFLYGELSVNTNQGGNSMVIANSPYSQSCKYVESKKRLFSKRHSLNRFCVINNLLIEAEKSKIAMTPEATFAYLDEAKVPSTKWTTGYDLSKGFLYFKTASQSSIKTLDWKKLDFTKVTYLPLICDYKTEVSIHFKPLEAKSNLELIQSTFQHFIVYQVNNDLNMVNEYQMNPEKEVKTTDFSQKSGTLILKIEGLKNSEGTLRIAYVDSEERYKKKQFNNAIIILPEQNKGEWVMYNLPFGEYVFGLHHDKNGDDKFNTFLGIPTEPFGFSNNVKFRLGFPKYKKTAIQFAHNEQVVSLKCK